MTIVENQQDTDWFSEAPLGRLVYDRTYSRVMENGQKEKWPDTCRRVVDGNLAFVDPKFIEPGEREALYELLLNKNLIPAGRHLWVTGVPGRQFIANCHIAAFETGFAEHCGFVFSELMKGGGVGANYSSNHLSSLAPLSEVEVRFICSPEHPDYEILLPYLSSKEDLQNITGFRIFERIPDSREGWVEALELLIRVASVPRHPDDRVTIVYNISDIRCKGTPIKGFGGISSGPFPLSILLKEVAQITQSYEKVTPEVSMIIDHLIASAVIAGNVRRCLPEGTLVHTEQGLVPIEKIEVGDIVAISKGDFAKVSATFNQGVQETIIIQTQMGPFECTPNHRMAILNSVDGDYNWVEASQLSAGDRLLFVPTVLPGTKTELNIESAWFLGNLANTSINVPDFILQGTPEIRAAYIAGLFDAGGSVKTKQTTKVASSVDSDYLRQVQALYASLGIPSRLILDHQQALYTLSIVGDKAVNQFKMMVGPYSFLSFLSFYPNKTWTGQSLYGPTDYVPVEVLTISAGRSVQTYDIEVEGAHEFIAQGLLVHNSARMSILHWKDPFIDWFLTCKTDHKNHWSTNISVEIDEEFFDDLLDPDSFASSIYEQVINGMLLDGEPGFFNSSLASEGEKTRIVSTNPCLTGDTVIATVEGPRTFASLAETGQDVLVYAWHPETKLPVIRMMRHPHRTGINVPILEVEFDSGLKVRCTPDHGFYSFRGKKIKAKNLTIGKRVRAFSISEHREGHLQIHGWNSERNLASRHWTSRQETNTKNHKVVAIREAGFADVYNGMVDDAHTYVILDPEPVAGVASGIISANCGEMAMEAWENCCLGHINLAFGEDDDHRNAFRLMARFLIRSTFADFQDPKQREVVLRNRRIGVGFFGLQEWLGIRGLSYSDYEKSGVLKEGLQDWYNIVRMEVDRYADELGINRPVKCTVIAPTGTIAKLAGTSEAAQCIYAKYYLRRVRYADNDPEVAKIIGAGIHVEPDLASMNTSVASFPCEDFILTRVHPDLVEEQHQIPIDTLLGIQAYIQHYYADNAISMTINVPQSETEESFNDIKNILSASLRKYLPLIKGTTVFPECSRPQSPIERLTKEQYEQMTHARMNAGESEQLLEECSTGACPVR